MTTAFETAPLRTQYGTFSMYTFDFGRGDGCHVLLTRMGPGIPLLRIQSHCLTSTAFDSVSCDCDAQLKAALAMLAKADFGVLAYLDQEARGHGLLAKTRVLRHLSDCHDLVEAQRRAEVPLDARRYDVVCEMLTLAGVPTSVALLANNPVKVEAVSRAGLRIVDRVPLAAAVDTNEQGECVANQRSKLGHLE